MALASRLTSLPARIALLPGPRVYRRVALVMASVASLLTALAFNAAPASAVVTEIGGSTVGVQPRETEEVLAGQFGATFNNPAGHPVLHSSRVYAIYWDPTDHYHGDWQNVIDTFLHNVNEASGSLASVFAVDAQYTDSSNQPAAYNVTFRGAYTDTNGYPGPGCTDPNPLGAGDRITCLTDQQIQEQLAVFIAQHGLQRGMGSIFYVLTPPGVTVCVGAGGPEGHCSDHQGTLAEIEKDQKERAAKEAKEEPYVEPEQLTSYEHSFCSYHSDVSPTNPVSGDANTILYSVIPWTAGGRADLHLEAADRTFAYDCQDGGFDPSSKPFAEKKEKAKEKSAKEKKEFEEKTLEEKAIQLRQEELEGPHSQEPNQLVPCPPAGPDGTCDTGLADLIINQIAVEQQNTLTNPLLNAWQDALHNESTDECRNWYAEILGGSETATEGAEAGTLFNQQLAGGHYYLNTAFNLAGLRLAYPGIACIPGAWLVPQFTSPSPVNSGDLVAFNGMESRITLNSAIGFPPGAPQSNYATYTWNFGDGTAPVSGSAPGAPACTVPWLNPCAASELHSYQYGGTYVVTLTVTDVAGNRASTTNPVTVYGPPPPGSASGKSAPGSAGAPVASVAVLSRSLRAVLRKGLLIAYLVNERVTGRFEVLLGKSVAHKLHLRAPVATGLPNGSPAQTVIGKAILVTLGGGHSRMSIKFSKSTVARLEHVRSASMMLRLLVRNATGGSATALVSFKLSH